jgi:hypothetical protein
VLTLTHHKRLRGHEALPANTQSGNGGLCDLTAALRFLQLHQDAFSQGVNTSSFSAAVCNSPSLFGRVLSRLLLCWIIASRRNHFFCATRLGLSKPAADGLHTITSPPSLLIKLAGIYIQQSSDNNNSTKRVNGSGASCKLLVKINCSSTALGQRVF